MHVPPPLQPELIATAPPVDTGKRPCRASDPLKWLCFHPFCLQSALSVQEVGLDLRGPTLRKGCTSQLPHLLLRPPCPP